MVIPADTPPKLVAFYDTLGIWRIHSQLNPRALTGVIDFKHGKFLYSETATKQPKLTVEFDNIFVVFAGKVFQQINGIPMGTNCAPLLTDIFLYSYDADFIKSLLSAGKKRLASQVNFTYRYIDDALSINNLDFEN